MKLEKECQGDSIAVSSSSSVSFKQQSHCINGQNSNNLSCNRCLQNFDDSGSSHGSSSGFESIKSGSSHVCSSGGTRGAIGGNSSSLRTSTACGSSSDLLLNNSQSRLSMQSNSSGNASLIINNIPNVFDDSEAENIHGDNLADFSRLSSYNMMRKGMPEAEILALWLGSLGYPEYLRAFLTQGYDLSTIARITPEDLIALGITHPIHRKFLISEIHTWRITDTWPTLVPSGELREWLPLIGLPEYVTLFQDQGYYRIDDIQNFIWEDFEDIGIKKLGHLKRLGLAIKKIKGHESGQIQVNNGVEQLGSVAVHHNRIGSQAAYDGLRSHLTPPPPAPTSTFHPNNLRSLCDNYITGRHYSHLREVFPAESRAQKQVVQVYPHYQSTVANKVGPYRLQGCGRQSLASGLNKQDTGSLEMNLCSLSRILSDESFQKHSAIRQRLPVFPVKILSTADNSNGSDSEDYPSPPGYFSQKLFTLALLENSFLCSRSPSVRLKCFEIIPPLACEGSIQFLRSAFNESTMAPTAEPGTGGSNFEQRDNESNSFSLSEQFSFAKDNCAAIKNRVSLPSGRKCCKGSTVTNFSQSNVPLRSYSTSASNGDVLNDIGCMLQNLKDELDAMLLPSQSV